MKENIQDTWISRVGMATIFFVSLGYVLFGSSFAQIRLEFSFLNFPIFIGEILLGLTSLLFIIKSVRHKWELGAWGWILAAYLFFILCKAFYGYHIWGPLAFRDAALFYYPFFVILGYSFWSSEFGAENIRRLILAMILLILILRQFVTFWPCSLIIMGVILALQAKSFKERMVLVGAVFICAPYGTLFNVLLRTVLLSSLITVIFIGVTFFILYCKNRWVRIVGAVLACIILGVVLTKSSQSGVWNTFVITDVKPLVTTLPQELSRGKYLYHPVGSLPEKPNAFTAFLQRMRERKVLKNEKCSIELYNEALGVKKEDTLFRFYIWRDMAFEYARYKPLFGFDFGRPLFSPTVLQYWGAAATEYTDGWVGAHNSFLYMMYRAGIVGLAMVLFVFALWFGLVRDFYILKDWIGVLLCAVLLNWIVSANFFLIFELPYTAIPVWTIFGITLKYRTILKNEKIRMA